jgi:hypothetical protein
MAPSWGKLVYRASVMMAGLIIAMATINYLYKESLAQPMIPVVPLLLAGAIWLIGIFCRSFSPR